MLYRSLLSSHSFWRLVECLDCLKSDLSIEYLLEESQASKDLFYETLTFFNEYGQHFVIRHTPDGHFLSPGTNALNLSLVEYMREQARGSYTVKRSLETQVEKDLEALANTFKAIEKLRRFKVLDKKELKKWAQLILSLEEAIQAKRVLKIKKEILLPRLCYFDEGLTLLGESCKDSRLVTIDLEENLSISWEKNREYSAKLGISDLRRVVDFIYESKYYA